MRVLFDTGQGLGILNNSLILKRPLSEIDALVLSHGHYDHTSGIPQVMQNLDTIPVYCHPDVFLERYWSDGMTKRHIGIRLTRSYLESLGCRFDFVSEFSEILPGVFVTGEVPRTTRFEPPDPNMKVAVDKDGHVELVQDFLKDDLSMVLDMSKGLVVILGCAHSGIINILRWVSSNLPGRSVHTVLGGTHLGFARPEQFEQTLAALEEFEIARLGASHCTGLENASRLYCALGQRFFHASVGVSVSL
jgi:7,8-dihydropterin-6-yl-methyl-4-(beta-D-ribofuranosyl)aminobenzene 5'-phosphate synthase